MPVSATPFDHDWRGDESSREAKGDVGVAVG
jgi:hypothetical protein